MECDTTRALTRRELDSVPRTPDVSSSAQPASESSPARWRVLAGNVCLIGGAAICAWIFLDHSLLRSQRASMQFPEASLSAPSQAVYHVSEAESVRAMRKTIASAIEHQRAGNGKHAVPHKRHTSGLRTLANKRSPTVAVTSSTLASRRTPAVSSHWMRDHSLARPQHVTAVSVMVGADDHVSISIPSNDIHQTVATRRSIDADDKNSVNWMSNMAQRRITEVSERFSK